MSIQSPVGTLDIKNATLRVGKLEVSNIQGVDTALNVTRSNAILIYDDQASTTTFTGFTSTPGVRDTSNGYLDLADGYVYWGQKLPNSWVMEFEMDIRSGTSAGPLYSNIFSTSNVGGDGYTFTFNDNNDKITLKYDGTTLTEATVSGLFTASENWQKVAINYERGRIAISIGASRKFFYQDIERETPYVNGEYINFSSASTDGRKIRNLKITNGAKWTYAGESNVAFQQGSVGIGVTDPAYTLDVGGDINLSGSFYQGGSPFVSSLWTDGANSLYYRSNVEVGTGNLFVDTTTSNVGIRTTTPAYELDVAGNVHADYFLGDGSLLTGLVTKLEDVVDNGNVSSNTIQLTNTDVGLKATGNVEAARFIGDGSHLTGLVTDLQSVVDNGNVSSNTIQLTNTDVGLKATGNVEAARFIGDGSHLTGLVTDLQSVVDNGNVSSNTIQLTNTDVGLKATGNVEAARFIGDGSHLTGLVTDLQSVSDNGNTTSNTIQFTNATTGFVTESNVGIANTNPQNDLDVGSNLSVLDTGSNVLSVTGNVSATSITIGDFQIVSAYGLDHVTNENNQTTDTIISTNATTGFNASSNIVAGGTVQANKIVSTSNLEVGTANLFVDTTTSNVGIGTNTPDYELDVVGNVNATHFIGDGSAISAIQSSNVSDFGSNVSRITNLESSRALKSDLNNNSSRITNLSSNLSDNSSRITALETGNMSISGDKTFTGDIIFESNIHMNGGNVFVANTVNMTVSDPIIELGSNNSGTNDLGIIMTRPNNNSNVAVVFDESVDILRMGYTLNGANDSIVDLDSNALAVSVQGALSAASVSGDGSGLSLIQSSNVSDFASNVTRIGTLETDLDSNVSRIGTLESGDLTIGGEKTFSSNLEVGTANLFVDTTTGRVGVGTESPGTLLELSKATGSATISPTELRLSTTTNAADWNVTDPWARLSFYTDDVTGDAPGVMASVGAVASSADGGENTRLAFFTAEPHLERMCIDRYGSVGIGTASPQLKMDVYTDDTSGSQLYLRNANTGGRGGLTIAGANGENFNLQKTGVNSSNVVILENYSTTNGGIHFYTKGDGDYRFRTTNSNSTRFLITNDGDVAVGAITPQSKLHVDGDVRMKTLSTNAIGKITPVYARGTGNNNNANRRVKIGDTTHVDGTGRGLTLTIINASTHAHVSSTIYDTYGSTTASNNLATALEAMTDAQIGILTSHDAFEDNMTGNLVTACLKLGLTRLAGANDDNNRHPYCAIFYGPGASGVAGNHAIEVMKSDSSSGAYATLSTFLVDDSFMGQTVTNALYSGTADNTIPTVFVNKNKNVGIGTASPVAQLHVASHGPTYTGLSGNDRFRIEEQATNGNSYGLQMGIDWGTGNSALQTYFLNSNGSYSQSYDLLLQPHGGDVGIGTNNPRCRLDVQGGGTRCSYPFGIGGSSTYATYTHTAVGGIANNAGSWTKDFVVGSYERGGWIRVYSGATMSTSSAPNGAVQSPKTAEFVYSIYGNYLFWNRVSGSTNISLSNSGYQTIRVTSSGGGSYNHGWVEIWQQGGVAIF